MAEPAPTNVDAALDADMERLRKEKKKAKEAEKAEKIARAKEKAEKAAAAKAAPAEAKKEKPAKAEKPAPAPVAAYVNTTPKGERKDTSQPMAATYDPIAVESAWYDWWEKQGYFKADNESTKEKFVCVIPPPNVTGSLHLGHTLMCALQDSITRWHRMSGREALWLPGTDHAGIATQTVVEKKIMREHGQTRHDLGREQFIDKVWEWKNVYGGKILNQLRRIGCSLDWDREVFTMDPNLNKAVTEAFVRLFDQGLLYRDTRLVNWCCRLNTAISDIEVDMCKIEKRTLMKVPGYEKLVEFGVITSFAYKVDGCDEEIVVATTRPETMLADTAVAIHPDDPRYKHLHGKMLAHPFNGRKIPIVCDSVLVDMAFGTGAVKVTPAHDPNDFACGKRNNLEFISMLNDDGTINEEGGVFKGMKRFDARYSVISALKEKGLLREQKDNEMVIPMCSRSKDIIEPMLKPQWYVNCKNMADRAIKVVESGELEIIPAEHKTTWFRWLEGIRDWCISRQLWWGHRCPAYLVSIDGVKRDTFDNWVVGRTLEEAQANARAKFPDIAADRIQLHQDEDVLDTWFSSGLFPFSVMGWPNETSDMKAFYPGQLLETGHDILFFWVARMVMMGLQLTDQIPFKQVYLHAIVRDAHGRKMSKSLGNVIDPLDMIEGISLEGLHAKLADGNLDPTEIEKAKKGQAQDFPTGIPQCGTDATRFALCSYTAQGRDVNLDVSRVAAYRNFCNKLWQAVKFTHFSCGEHYQPGPTEPVTGLTIGEKWILSRLDNATTQCEALWRNYEFAQITTVVYNFWLYELCDVYLELMKPIMQANPAEPGIAERQASAKETLYTCIDNGLRLLHPFMPFVTEELYHRIHRRRPTDPASIMVSPYPVHVDGRSNPAVERQMEFIQEVISTSRKLRQKFGLTTMKPKIYVNVHSQEWFDVLSDPDVKNLLLFLSRSSEVEPTLALHEPPEGCAVEIVNEATQVYMQVKGMVDIPTEITKLEKARTKTQGSHDQLVKDMAKPTYNKVPEKVRNENTEKLAALLQELTITDKAIESLRKFL
eukprot:TRINITY_DN3506_c0_g1_i1.p1 TRINITY_DN3506_c0_g1~~TRINITY_DN3506_c0_g1_i1.p1  ORF type:complete len:1121 (+),score=466.98 TRINITY_DN3506_c0_g1_i1:209-3364(+)